MNAATHSQALHEAHRRAEGHQPCWCGQPSAAHVGWLMCVARRAEELDLANQRLYGVPDAEDLFFELADAYERQADEWGEPGSEPVVIEEWTVHPPEYHLPSPHDIVEWIVEWTADNGEITEGFDNGLALAARRDEVYDAAEALRQAIARGITYRMADTKVAEHVITWDAEGQPLVDGERLYRSRRAEVD